MATTSAEWLGAFAARLGVEPPSDSDVDALLALAGVAARSSERTAAPVSCFLVALAGRTPAEGLAAAAELAEALGD